MIEKLSKDEKGNNFPSVIGSLTWVDFGKIVDAPIKKTDEIFRFMSNPSAKILWPYLHQSKCALSFLVKVLKIKSSIYSKGSGGDIAELDLNQSNSGATIYIRESLKRAVRFSIQTWIRHGCWMYDYLHNRRYVCKDNEESRCASEIRQCVEMLGQIVSYITQLYCAKESISIGSPDCCFLIRDTIMSELENIDYSACFNPLNEKKVGHVLRKKISGKIQLHFMCTLATFDALQSGMADILGLKEEYTIICGISH